MLELVSSAHVLTILDIEQKYLKYFGVKKNHEVIYRFLCATKNHEAWNAQPTL